MSRRASVFSLGLAVLLSLPQQAFAKIDPNQVLSQEQFNSIVDTSITNAKGESVSLSCVELDTKKGLSMVPIKVVEGTTVKNLRKVAKNKIKRIKKKIKRAATAKKKKKLKKKLKKVKKLKKNRNEACALASNNPPGPIPGDPNAVSLDPVAGALTMDHVHTLMDKACFGFSAKENRIRDRMLGQGISGVDEIFNRVAEPSGLMARADDLLNEQEGVSLEDAEMTVRGQRMRTVEILANTNNACLERMAIFLRGLLTVGEEVIDEDCEVQLLYNYNERLRTSVGEMDMRDLLLTITTDPYMLDYLDGDDNKKDNPNENFAREQLELFSTGPRNLATGEANYTEGGGVGDIDKIARRNAGWHVGEFTNGAGETTCESIFVPADHDSTVEILFAGTGNDCPADTETDVVNCIFDNRADTVAEFYADQLIREYLTAEPPLALIQNLAAEIKNSNFKLGGANGPIAKFFKSKAFYHADYKDVLPRQSIEYAMAIIRQLGGAAGVLPYTVFGNSGLERRIANGLAQQLTAPPSVFYWYNETWVSPSVDLERINFVTGILDDSNALEGDDEDNPLWEPEDILNTNPEATARDVIQAAAEKLGVTLSQEDEDDWFDFMIKRDNGDGTQDLVGYFPPTDVNIGLGMLVGLTQSHDYVMK